MVRCDGCGAMGHSTTQAGRRHLDCGTFRDFAAPIKLTRPDLYYELGANFQAQITAHDAAIYQAFLGQQTPFAGVDRARAAKPAPATKAYYNEAAEQGLAYYEDLVAANAAIDSLKRELAGARERLATLTEKHARMEVDLVQLRAELEREQRARAKAENELRRVRAARRFP